MNAISIGPFVFSNDRFIAVLTVIAFLGVAELLAWRNRGRRDAIHRWTGAVFVIWVITARLGYVVAHWDVFASAPLSVFAIWQGGFDIRAGTFGLGATLFAAFLSQSRAGGPVLGSVGMAFLVFTVATLLLPDETRGRLPITAFEDLSGAPISLANRDVPVVLNLWATWCPPCRREMPMMTDVAQSQGDVDIIFANQGERDGVIGEYLVLNDLPADGMIRDPDSALMQKFGMLGLPSTLFFAADGSLQAVHTGEISRAALLAAIDDLRRKASQ